MSESNWLTPQALEKLQKELVYLESDGRIQISERIAEARAHGDLRENAEYDAAKNEQGLMEARIRKLRYLVENSEIRDPSSSGTVESGSVVTVVDGDGDEMNIFIASAENRLPGYIMASPGGPLATALMGAAPGDEVSYEAPGGLFTYTVVDIHPFEG